LHTELKLGNQRNTQIVIFLREEKQRDRKYKNRHLAGFYLCV